PPSRAPRPPSWPAPPSRQARCASPRRRSTRSRSAGAWRGNPSCGGSPPPADRLDLDLRELGAEARLAAVAALRLVLADRDLVAQRRAADAPRHLRLGRKLERAVAAEHEHVGVEGLALLRRQAVDEQAL